MKKLFVIFAAALLAAPVLGQERSVGLNVTYGPDSYLVDYPSGYQQTLNADVTYTEVYKKDFFRFGWSAGLGYAHLWGDNVETKSDVDEMIDRNDARGTFDEMTRSLFSRTGMKAKSMFESYQWIYSDFHGFSTSGEALAGVEKGIFGVDLLSGLGFDYAFMKTRLGEVEYTDDLKQSIITMKTVHNVDVDPSDEIDKLRNDLGGTCHMMQFSVPLEARPFVKVTKNFKIAGSVRADVYAFNLLFGDQTYTKNLWFKNWEFGLGAEFVF